MTADHRVGLYLSVPFCKAKCSFCNFASDAFAPGRMDGYVDRLCEEIRGAGERAERMEAELGREADSIYFGGGTPSLLSDEQFRRIFAALRNAFDVTAGAETTLECAPGQLEEKTLTELLWQGVNRVSLGVQSFVDRESAAVGRLHTGAQCEAEIARLRAAGVNSIGLDLIAGLPHQTEASWRESVQRAIACGVDHVSVYMLEIDEDSRLGREVISGGVRYGADVMPSEDEAAAFYERSCEMLDAAGIRQYEISNFACEGRKSKHNLKYWRRLPYLGFGLDAHSMLPRLKHEGEAIRFQNIDNLNTYMGSADGVLSLLPFSKTPEHEAVRRDASFEESLFLGLRLNEGVDLDVLRERFGFASVQSVMPAVLEAREAGMVQIDGECVRLTARGRMASNEVFSRLLLAVAT
ncbi:MAG: radical SAM family heme chaperone HemW [Acidobacteria bacterium]|nr:radical SAM family heme chaperone HemW [Acidobacteriota bacterium]